MVKSNLQKCKTTNIFWDLCWITVGTPRGPAFRRRCRQIFSSFFWPERRWEIISLPVLTPGSESSPCSSFGIPSLLWTRLYLCREPAKVEILQLIVNLHAGRPMQRKKQKHETAFVAIAQFQAVKRNGGWFVEFFKQEMKIIRQQMMQFNLVCWFFLWSNGFPWVLICVYSVVASINSFQWWLCLNFKTTVFTLKDIFFKFQDNGPP